MHRRAVTHLKRADPILARIIAQVGPCRFAARPDGTHFDAVVRAIVGQQLSMKAAASIYARVQALFGARTPTAAELLATSDDALRAAGLSWAKIRYVKDLSAQAAAGTLPVERLHELDDAAVMEALIRVKGIGRWTAHMFLMFRLGRPDIVPELDLGVRKAVQRAYKLRRLPSPARVLAIGRRWAPYGSVATWYLWRSLEITSAAVAAKTGGAPSARTPTARGRAPKTRRASSPRR